MLQRIDAAAGLFDLLGHQLAGFFHFGQAQHIRQDLRQRLYCAVQIAGA